MSPAWVISIFCPLLLSISYVRLLSAVPNAFLSFIIYNSGTSPASSQQRFIAISLLTQYTLSGIQTLIGCFCRCLLSL